jgi:hypothetical protein
VNATALLNELESKGVRLYRNAENLKFQGPKGIVTAAYRAAIQDFKTDLLRLVDERDTRRTSEPRQTVSNPSWEDHLADVRDLSRFPLLPCEECGGRNFAKGRVKHGPLMWLCRDCIRPLTRSEVEALRVESESRGAEPGYFDNDDPVTGYPEDRAGLITLLRDSGCELWTPPKGGLAWKWANMPPEGPALMERRKADLMDELQAEREAFEYLRVHNTAIDRQNQQGARRSAPTPPRR